MTSNKHLNIEIVTPQKVIYTGEANSVILPGQDGSFQVLIDHAPIVSSLNKGKILIKDTDNISQAFASTNGFVEVRNNKVSILVESAVNN